MEQQIPDKPKAINGKPQEDENSNKRRWKILKNAILKRQAQQGDASNPASVRRFSSFRLLATHELPQKQDGDGHRWTQYTCLLRNDFSVDVRHLSSSFSAGELIGFNNTGNVCVWPAEEILTYHCLKNSELFCKARICELGGGMTCLAGLVAAICSDADEVLLTDGNEMSVKNVEAILCANSSKFGQTGVTSRELKWNEREAFQDLTGRFDHILSADCLFFDQFRQDLVETIDILLKPKGVATIFAPRRGKTLEDFCQLAQSRFEVSVDHKYDSLVWQRHQEMLSKGKEVYDEDIHYPVMITVTR